MSILADPRADYRIAGLLIHPNAGDSGVQKILQLVSHNAWLVNTVDGLKERHIFRSPQCSKDLQTTPT